MEPSPSERSNWQSRRSEIEKIMHYLVNMENVIHLSPSIRQRERIKKAMARYKERLQKLVPNIDPFQLTISQICQELELQFPERSPQELAVDPESSPELHNFNEGQAVLERIHIERVSPNCNDPEINFMATILYLVEIDYWPVISDAHCKLDFSHSVERNDLHSKLESLKRNLKRLVNTFEEYALTERKDLREQIQGVKILQSRIFLLESNNFIQKLGAFLGNLVAQMNASVLVVQNYKEEIKFEPRLEKATILAGKTIEEGIEQFHSLCRAIVKKLALPNIEP